MSDNEYKKFDSQAGFKIHNARLAKDPQVIEGGDKPMVKLTFVCTSRSDRHSDLWVEATVRDMQSDLAQYLKKGDVLGIEGFPALRRWGDNNEKFSFELVRAELMPSIELFQAAKERGFTPGAGRNGNNDKKYAGKKALGARAAKRQIRDLDDDLPAEG